MSPIERANFWQGSGFGYLMSGFLVWYGTTSVYLAVSGIVLLVGGLAYEVVVLRRKP